MQVWILKKWIWVLLFHAFLFKDGTSILNFSKREFRLLQFLVQLLISSLGVLIANISLEDWLVDSYFIKDFFIVEEFRFKVNFFNIYSLFLLGRFCFSPLFDSFFVICCFIFIFNFFLMDHHFFEYGNLKACEKRQRNLIFNSCFWRLMMAIKLLNKRWMFFVCVEIVHEELHSFHVSQNLVIRFNKVVFF